MTRFSMTPLLLEKGLPRLQTATLARFEDDAEFEDYYFVFIEATMLLRTTTEP